MDDEPRPTLPSRARPGVPWLALGCLATYAVLSGLVAVGTLDRPDRAVYRFCLEHRNATVVAAARHLTSVLQPAVDGAVLALGAGLIAWRRHRLRPLLVAALVGWTMAAVVAATKVGVGRPKPALHVRADGLSFPSGHTAAFLVCFGALVLIATTRRRSRRTPLLAAVAVGTALVAAALVYNGYHWLFDTVASVVLGFALLDLQHRYFSSGRPGGRPSGQPPEECSNPNV